MDLDDAYIYKLLPFIESQGFQSPPYFGPGLHGAHITVACAQEAKAHHLIGKIKEVGCKVSFAVKNCNQVQSLQQSGLTFFILEVEAPYLDALRQKYGLPKCKYPWHITVGTKQLAASA